MVERIENCAYTMRRNPELHSTTPGCGGPLYFQYLKRLCVGHQTFPDIFVDFYQIVSQFLQSLSLAFIVGIFLDMSHKPSLLLSVQNVYFHGLRPSMTLLRWKHFLPFMLRVPHHDPSIRMFEVVMSVSTWFETREGTVRRDSRQCL